MIRQIIKIDEEKCNGCGLCVDACHESALAIIDGKAKLIRDDYCDGMGDCLPGCPTGALTFETREALPYDEEAVLANQKKKEEALKKPVFSGCPGSQAKRIKREENGSDMAGINISSQLNNWPCQIKLAPVQADYYDGTKLLIAADCTAYAYANMHQEFMRGKVTLIGCPKLDSIDYSEKLTEIIKNNDIQGVTIVRMQVPCCGGLERAAKTALQDSGKFIPWQVVTISTDGRILD